METASEPLCEELYKVSRWNTFGPYWKDGELINIVDMPCEPAYDLGFLVRKLPPTASIIKSSDHYQAYWHNFDKNVAEIADTAEDATVKLCLALFEAGILTREGEDDG